ncbi:MAG: signal peptidase II [Lachnospiraceae bacterium]|nr:signal peptidase II [Lachnospiraceae bacterium]
MKTKTGLNLAGSIVTLSLIVVDQFTKYLAETTLAGTSGISMIPGVFEFYYLENTGAAFGMLDNRQIFFVAIAFVISAFAVYVYIRTPCESRDRAFYYPLRLICVLLTAGALGNMIDRLTHGYVVDFLYFSLIDFPVFNLADCYVCVGAGLALIFLFTKYRSEEFVFLKIRK